MKSFAVLQRLHAALDALADTLEERIQEAQNRFVIEVIRSANLPSLESLQADIADLKRRQAIALAQRESVAQAIAQAAREALVADQSTSFGERVRRGHAEGKRLRAAALAEGHSPAMAAIVADDAIKQKRGERARARRNARKLTRGSAGG